MTHPTRIKLAAYAALLLTLFLPFSRCSHGTPAPASPGGATSLGLPAGEASASLTGESPAAPPEPPESPAMPTPASVTTPSPWYHLFERNSPEADYQYGMDLLIESWAVPTALPKEFDPIMLVPGRMFYVWPLATLVVALGWPPLRWRRSFHFIEIVLGLGGMWWAFMATVMNEAMRGLYVAEAAIALYAFTALYEWVAEWRRLRRERNAASSLAA